MNRARAAMRPLFILMFMNMRGGGGGMHCIALQRNMHQSNMVDHQRTTVLHICKKLCEQHQQQAKRNKRNRKKLN